MHTLRADIWSLDWCWGATIPYCLSVDFPRHERGATSGRWKDTLPKLYENKYKQMHYTFLAPQKCNYSCKLKIKGMNLSCYNEAAKQILWLYVWNSYYLENTSSLCSLPLTDYFRGRVVIKLCIGVVAQPLVIWSKTKSSYRFINLQSFMNKDNSYMMDVLLDAFMGRYIWRGT